MPRGSKPGERRGGRRRQTPNRTTVLADRILVAATATPEATPQELLAILVRDDALPPATRMAIARKTSPSKMRANGHANSTPYKPRQTRAKAGRTTIGVLDVLFRIAQDVEAKSGDRRKAALEAAQFFLPKNPRGPILRRRKFPPDECGFSVDPELARELRDAKLKLACLPPIEKTTPVAFARKVRKLHARIDEIRRSLQSPGPEKYSTGNVKRDIDRLEILRQRRMSGAEFPSAEDLEEAVRTARYDSFLVGPEITSRRRLVPLRDKKRIEDQGGPLLTPVEHINFRFLSLLYPPPPKSIQDLDEESREAILRDHPFEHPQYIVGNPNYPDGFLFYATPQT
jgi:hypothetical protein